MELNELLKRRYSCRDYNKKKISEDDILKMLNNAVLAPNAGNLQSWKFVVISNETKKEEVAESCLEQKWMTKANVQIIVLEDLNYVKRHYGKRAELYCIQNSSLAASNIMITAASLNIDSCFVSAFDEEMLKRCLGISEGIVPYCVITLGYSNDKVEEKKRFALNNSVFFEKYGNKQLDKNILPLNETVKKLKSKIGKKSKKLIKHTK